MNPGCAHLGEIAVTALPGPDLACVECLESGASWLHLRMCQKCGHVACCDSSPNRHASAHARVTGHPVARSVEAGENWSWCYVDEVAFVVATT